MTCLTAIALVLVAGAPASAVPNCSAESGIGTCACGNGGCSCADGACSGASCTAICGGQSCFANGAASCSCDGEGAVCGGTSGCQITCPLGTFSQPDGATCRCPLGIPLAPDAFALALLAVVGGAMATRGLVHRRRRRSAGQPTPI